MKNSATTEDHWKSNFLWSWSNFRFLRNCVYRSRHHTHAYAHAIRSVVCCLNLFIHTIHREQTDDACSVTTGWCFDITCIRMGSYYVVLLWYTLNANFPCKSRQFHNNFIYLVYLSTWTEMCMVCPFDECVNSDRYDER